MEQKKSAQVNIKVTEDLKKSLLEYADSMHWTISILCCQILEKWVSDAKEGKISTYDFTTKI